MVEDGVYYEFYGNYRSLFWGWFFAYALLILLPVFVFGRKRLSRLSLKKQLSVGIPTMAVLVALPFALVAESYFAYRDFMDLCRTEAPLKIYQPMPAYVPGYAVDLGDDVSLDELSSCTDRCRIALVDYGYEFFEQISFKRPRDPEAMRWIIRRGETGYEYVPYSDDSALRVYRFFLRPVGEAGCTEEQSQPAYWVPPGQPRRFCIHHEVSGELRSDRMLEEVAYHMVGCCRLQRKLSSVSVSSGSRLAETSNYRYGFAPYLGAFGHVSWGRAVARFDRCEADVENDVKIDALAVAVIGFSRGNL